MSIESLSLYIHWPFCASKCPYCDFNSHVREAVDQQAWQDAYLKELSHYAVLTPGRRLTSIFFGGGTPSLMAPETANAIIEAASRHWTLDENAEITLEANPTSVETEKFSAFKDAGINRVSLGVQSLRDRDLKFLGRRHSAAEALKALGTAASHFDRYSFDLIYARPEQTIEDWRAELGEALFHANGHLSVYQLTIEPGTAFHTQHARGDFSIPDEETAGAFYEMTQNVLGAAGLPAYEISNHARPGQESRHNLAYWRYSDYVGVGPGAHGRLTLQDGNKVATRGHQAPEIWLERVRAQGHGGHPFDEITREQRFTEALMMGLRLREGVAISTLEREAGKSLSKTLNEKKLQTLADEDLIVTENGFICPTLAGMQRLNGVLAWLVA